MLPPATQRLHGKLGGIMINPHTHPAVVRLEVVHTIGNALAQVLVNKILAADLERLPLVMPFPPRILEISDQLFFRDLSRERESSEQFVWLNRRYGETETQLSRSAIMPSIRADSSQNEVI
jgi:hypothetical protein